MGVVAQSDVQATGCGDSMHVSVDPRNLFQGNHPWVRNHPPLPVANVICIPLVL